MQPRDEADLCEALANAAAPGSRLPPGGALTIRGGGTRALFAPASGQGISTRALSGVTLYEPGALTLVARAGTPLSEIRSLLAGHRQRLPFDPPDYAALQGRSAASTLGGVVATNASGPARIAAGACRDCLIGVTFADGRGRLIRNGGRVMKNVTGYDLVKLLAGSEGRLGVLSALSFRLHPQPEAEATLVLHGIAAADQARLMSRALGSPWEISGAAAHPLTGEVYLRIEGFAEQIRHRSASLRDWLAPAEISLREGEASAALWTELRDLTRFVPCEAVIRVALRPSRLATLLSDLSATTTAPLELQSDLGGAHLFIGASAAAARSLLPRLQARAAAEGGHARLLKAPADWPPELAVLQPLPAATARLNAAIAARFDPHGLFATAATAPGAAKAIAFAAPGAL